MPPHKKHEREDYGATGKTQTKTPARKGAPIPDGRRNSMQHDVESDPDTRKRRIDTQ